MTAEQTTLAALPWHRGKDAPTSWVDLPARSLLAAIFPTNFADPMQEINFETNLTMAGSFLLAAKLGVTAFSFDAHLATR